MGLSATLMKRKCWGDVLCTNLPFGQRSLFGPCCPPGWRTNIRPSQRIPQWPAYGLPSFGLPLQLHMGQVGGYDHVGHGCVRRPPVKQAAGSEGAVSVCSRRKAGTCVPPQGKVGAHHSNRKENGQCRPDGEHNVADAFRGGSSTSAPPVSESRRWRYLAEDFKVKKFK